MSFSTPSTTTQFGSITTTLSLHEGLLSGQPNDNSVKFKNFPLEFSSHNQRSPLNASMSSEVKDSLSMTAPDFSTSESASDKQAPQGMFSFIQNFTFFLKGGEYKCF